jgi:hypothetical protein
MPLSRSDKRELKTFWHEHFFTPCERTETSATAARIPGKKLAGASIGAGFVMEVEARAHLETFLAEAREKHRTLIPTLLANSASYVDGAGELRTRREGNTTGILRASR